MKVLAICEPYVTPIGRGVKHFETRSYPTNYRGVIYIHTSKRVMPDPVPCSETEYPLGCIVLRAELVNCIRMTEEFIRKVKEETPEEYAYGFYEVGRYAWELKNVEEITPISARGMLGIWNYNA